MRDQEELVSSLHMRMRRKRRVRERRLTSAMGAACAGLSLCLVALVFGGGLHPAGTASMYSGAAILFEDAGPHVLTALVAFMLGVVVTAALMRKGKREERETDENAGERAWK